MGDNYQLWMAGKFVAGHRSPVDPWTGIALGAVVLVAGLVTATNFRGITKKIHDTAIGSRFRKNSFTGTVEYQRLLGGAMTVFGTGVIIYEFIRML